MCLVYMCIEKGDAVETKQIGYAIGDSAPVAADLGRDGSFTINIPAKLPQVSTLTVNALGLELKVPLKPIYGKQEHLWVSSHIMTSFAFICSANWIQDQRPS